MRGFFMIKPVLSSVDRNIPSGRPYRNPGAGPFLLPLPVIPGLSKGNIPLRCHCEESAAGGRRGNPYHSNHTPPAKKIYIL